MTDPINRLPVHTTHELMLDALAEVWAEGYAAGESDSDGFHRGHDPQKSVNPYLPGGEFHPEPGPPKWVVVNTDTGKQMPGLFDSVEAAASRCAFLRKMAPAPWRYEVKEVTS